MASNRETGSSADAVQAAMLVEKVTGTAWATDPIGNFIYVTRAAPLFRGLTLEQLNASNEEATGWKQLIHSDDYIIVVAAWRQAIESGAPYQADHRMLGATGTYIWMRASGQPLRDVNERIVGWYGCLIDSPKVPEPDRLNGAGLDLGMVHPHDRLVVAQASARAFFHGVPQISSYRQLQADGSYQWVELRIDSEHRASVDPGIAVALQNDAWTVVEELGETVEAVRAAKLLENLYGGAWALDARGRFTYATPTSQTSIGMTLEDLNQSLDGREFIDGGEHGWKRTVHPEDYEQMSKGFRTGLVNGEPWNVEYRILRANGDYVWHRVGARPTFDDGGRVTGWYGISLDIDVYKKTEAALRERERELSQLVDMVPSHIWRLTPDGEPTFFNKRVIEYVGFDVVDLDQPDSGRWEAMVGRALHPDDAAEVTAQLANSLATGIPFSMLCRLRRFDGQFRWMSTRAVPLRNENGRVLQWYGLCHDIDDEVRAREQLRLAQERLAVASQAASLAELSASIAHEVNQPLAAVVANAHACQRWLTADPPRLDRALMTMERILRDANAAADVVSRTRELFKQAVSSQTTASLASVIAEARRMLADAAVTHGVDIEVQVAPDLPAIKGDPVQLQQVLVNLMRNGIEAMEIDGRGKILHVRSERDGEFARVEVADEGMGLSDPSRVFDAFYTTKQGGMGMGLAISRSIVESQGGQLWVESDPGEGARFNFTLPLVAEAS